MDGSTETDSTVDRLLDSAIEVFAEKGYRSGTIKDICERADANLAAVNYHFGSKEELYSEAWKKAFHDSLEKYPPDGGIPDDAPPKERLKGRIDALIRRIADRENQDLLFAHKEMANPTPLGKDVVKECIQPLVEDTIELLRDMMGPDASEQDVKFCERSIVSQCLHVLHLREKKEMFDDDGSSDPIFPDIDDLDDYTEHVYEFSLAGVRRILNRNETG